MTTEKQRKQGIVVASFGTTYKETCRKTIRRIEEEVRQAFPGNPVERAFTSSMVKKKLLLQNGESISSPEEAFRKMAEQGCREIAVLPTLLLGGVEYELLARDVESWKPKFDHIVLGRPLLDSIDDCDRVIQAVMKELPVKEDEVLVLMGHGTRHKANAIYETVNERLRALGYGNVSLGTVEAKPGFDEVFARVQERCPKRVILAPFLLVAGDHATNDLAGDGANSWKSRFEAAGYPVECVLKGLGEYSGVRSMFRERLAGILEP